MRWSKIVISLNVRGLWREAIEQWLREKSPISYVRAVSTATDLVPWNIPAREGGTPRSNARKALKELLATRTFVLVDGEIRLPEDASRKAKRKATRCTKPAVTDKSATKNCGTDNCACCGKAYKQKRSDAKYCSNACRQRSYRIRNAA